MLELFGGMQCTRRLLRCEAAKRVRTNAGYTALLSVSSYGLSGLGLGRPPVRSPPPPH
jgi:hypothetical protein